ncbi:putative sporulation protein YtxC [Clostridium vincentii]|uniref:YtxC-like family protein n=1 Tax=Clostridium vincentii TaxID=52704 RepID=A0A2T0BG51_9CLOT|nr:putative sporulation protein YtxC [Clostridium vincentii]PRR82891.1 YtxC-like family protein [Clostridium vincentii]
MVVQELAYSGDLDVVRELQELKALLKKKNIVIGIVESLDGITHVIKVVCDDEGDNEKNYTRINLYISNILYNIVIQEYKEKEMFQFLTDTYFFLKQEEILEVEEKIMNVLLLGGMPKDNIFIYCSNKVNTIIEKIKGCIEENKKININGFITFRMRELREDIEQVIDKVVEKYMVEKEYKEFIGLLKYFVDIQESKIEEVNLIVQPLGGYIINDGYGEDIFSLFLKDLTECKLGVDANIEDILISGLITNAPNHIIIHNKQECANKEFIDTILSVFGSRVTICDGCELCTSIIIK